MPSEPGPVLREVAVPWEEILEVLFSRWKTIALFVAAGVVLAVLRVAISAPEYRATATIILQENRARYTVSPTQGFRQEEVRNLIEQEATLLRSPALTRAVLSRFPVEQPAPQSPLMRIVRDPFSLVRVLNGVLHKIPLKSELQARVESTTKRIRVQPIGGTNLIRVSFLHADPEWAALFVNTLLAEHVDRNVELNQPARALQFFHQQRALLSEKRETAQRTLDEFRQRYDLETISSAEIASGDDTVLADLERRRSQAETEAMELRAEVTFLQEQLSQQSPNVTAESSSQENQSIQLLRSNLVQLELDKSELLTRYAPESTVVRDIDERIDKAKKLLQHEQTTIAETTQTVNPTYQAIELDLIEAEARLSAVEARYRVLGEQVDGRQRELEQLGELAPELERLENELTNAREAYQTYLRKEEEARFSTALDESRLVNLTVTEPAEVPTTPERSGGAKSIVFLAIFGGLLGSGLAFLLDWLNPTVRSSAQARRLSGYPVLGEIP